MKPFPFGNELEKTKDMQEVIYIFTGMTSRAEGSILTGNNI